MKPKHKVTFIKLSCIPNTPRDNMLNLKHAFYSFTQLMLQICFFPQICSKLTQYMCSETNAHFHVNCLLTFYCNHRNWSYSKNFLKTLKFLVNFRFFLSCYVQRERLGEGQADRQILLGAFQWYIHARRALQMTWKMKADRTRND